MRIIDVISEGPVQAAVGGVGQAAGGVANTLGRATGAAAEIVPAAAKKATTGFQSGYDKMDKALKGMGKSEKPGDKDPKDVDRKLILNRALSGQMLNFSDVESVKALIKGVQDGTIKTNQNPNYLIKGLSAAANGQKISPEHRPSVEAFRDEA
jgi:hypothetical protein